MTDPAFPSDDQPADVATWPPPMVTPAPTGMRCVPLFVLAVAAALAVGVAVGAGVGSLIFSASAASCSPSDGWCDLGAAVVGVLAGLLVGAVGYVVTGVLVVRHHRPRGARAGHVAAVVLFPPAALLVLSIAGELLASVR